MHLRHYRYFNRGIFIQTLTPPDTTVTAVVVRIKAAMVGSDESNLQNNLSFSVIFKTVINASKTVHGTTPTYLQGLRILV